MPLPGVTERQALHLIPRPKDPSEVGEVMECWARRGPALQETEDPRAEAQLTLGHGAALLASPFASELGAMKSLGA